jgi:hypothetical protein
MSENNNTYQISSIIPTPVSMVAVYYDPEEMEIVRQDVICLAIIRYPNDEGDGYWDYIEPMVGDRDGSIVPADWQDGFLGVEYGKELNWDSKIRQMDQESQEAAKTEYINRQRGN